MEPKKRTALIEQMLQEYARLLDERLPEGPLTLDDIETVVEELGRQQDRRLEELLIEDQLPPPENQLACPKCPGAARFKRLVPREVFTIHGTRRLERRYYWCSACGHGFAPLDARLALHGKGATRQLRAWLARMGSEAASFAYVPGVLRDLRGWEISESTVERTTVEVGTAMAEVAATQARELVPAPERSRRGRGPGVSRLYIGIDGVYCPLREKWCKDQSLGRLKCRYGECKIGVVYQAKQQDDWDNGVQWAAYTATLQKVKEFTPQLVALARTHGSDRARELVVVGDGAEWIWNLATEYFPRAVQIVDFWHMTQHLYHVANEQFGPGTSAGKEWVEGRQSALKHDLVNSTVAKIHEWKPSTEEGRRLRDTEAAYFENNRERMRYGTFLKAGYHIGSGVVEATCRHVVAQRLKLSGMHWREATAEAVLAIRARLRSTAPTDLRTYC